MAAGLSVDLEGWRREFDELMLRVGGQFIRVGTAAADGRVRPGLMAGLPRVNCWRMAEHAGEQCRGGCSGCCRPRLGTTEAVRGTCATTSWSISVPRADPRDRRDRRRQEGHPTAGCNASTPAPPAGSKTLRSQSTSPIRPGRGHTLIDRVLYLPESWTTDPERVPRSGYPTPRVCDQTRPSHEDDHRRAGGGRARDWVAGDEVYGADPTLRATWRPAGSDTSWPSVAIGSSLDTGPARADEVAEGLPENAWQECRPATEPRSTALRLGVDRHQRRQRHSRHRWLLIRRNNDSGEYAYYRCYATGPVPLDHAGPRRRATLGSGGRLRIRQRPRRPRRTPGVALELLAPLDGPVHAGPRIPHRPGHQRTRHRNRSAGPGPVDPQRDLQAVHRAIPAAGPHPPTYNCTGPDGDAGAQATARSLPLPADEPSCTHMITKCRRSTNPKLVSY